VYSFLLQTTALVPEATSRGPSSSRRTLNPSQGRTQLPSCPISTSLTFGPGL
jgi:hypothetical protein